MHSLPFLLPLVSALLIAPPGLAQPSQPRAPSRQTVAGGWITRLQPEQWQASDLEGLDVYSSNNGDKIGDISELILDSSGKVQAVVIGIGGYLGIGTRHCSAVRPDQVRDRTTQYHRGHGHRRGPIGKSQSWRWLGRLTVSRNGGTAGRLQQSLPVAYGCEQRTSPAAPETQRMGQASAGGSGSTPDHAILLMSITKDELQAAPEFRAAR